MSEMIYESQTGDPLGFPPNEQNLPRPSVFNEPKKKKYRNCYKSKWANLKFFLQDKASLEASVNLLKTKTVEQFSTKCKEIYTKKIEIQLSTEKNRKLISQGVKLAGGYEDISSQIKVSDGISGLPTDAIQTFLFIFRENNHLMLKLIENIDNRLIDILVPFLCHFFYENFYMESTEQEEIIYIIYLLLEKEIDQLITPSEQSFLDNSFISKFLKEIGSRYEIKNYIDIILNELICNLEESYCNFYFLDITKFPKNSKITYEITPEGEIKFNTINLGQNFSSSLKNNSKMEQLNLNQIDKNAINKNLTKRATVIIKMPNKNVDLLINCLPKDVGIPITEKVFMEAFNKEKNDIMKQFYLKQLKKIKFSENPNLYDPYQLHENLKKKKKIAKESLDQFNNGVKLVTNFIDNLLTNLENDTIVPYSIKVICKFIYILMQKKFKTITKLELNNFVGKFLFDKLILPILRNPDRSDAGKDRMITLVTRKNLINIYTVFKNLVKGELFSSDQNINLVVFNKYIIDNYYRINTIIERMIDVRIPEKLKKLSEQFYKDDDFVLDNSKRSEEEINYEYFKENPNDFMQHKSICFTITELNMFYETVEAHKDLFIEPGKPLEKTYETLSNFISMIKGKPNHYFVIISDNYNEDAKKLLFHKEKTMPLGKAKTQEEIIQNLHYCISYLIGNLEILPHWDWVIENYKTMDTFEYINQYLNSYEGIYNFCPGSVPLNWYSLYIINNLNYIKPEDAINDYQPLYDDIETQIRIQLKKLSRLNEFLTVNMTTKFLLIDHKIKIFEEELENVKNTYINIKTLQFMEKKNVLVSLATLEEYKNKNIPIETYEYTGYKNLVLQKETYVPTKNDRNKKKDKEDIPPKNYIFFCNSINHFIYKFTEYYDLIYEELKQIKDKNMKNRPINGNEINLNPETRAKYVIDEYMTYILDSLDECKIFEPPPKKNNEDGSLFRESIAERESIMNANIENEKPKDIPSECKEKAKHSILNFILKTLCIKLYDEPILKEDIDFNQRCISLSWIKPENLAISNEIYDESIFEKIIEHFKKIDDLRTPEEMLNELGLAVQLINSLFIFMLNKEDSDADSFTAILIYIIIMARPKRMIFNLKFIEFFFDESNKKGKLEYNLTQAKSSIQFIMTMTGKDLGLEEDVFQKKCSDALNLEKTNKKAAPLPQI